MSKISRSSLLETYGIDLPVGKFKLYLKGASYDVFSVRDDTEGCPLLGRVPTSDGVANCGERNATLLDMVVEAEEEGRECWIEVS